LRARLWTVEVGREAVNFDRLRECQRSARAGLFAESLAGFVKWLARDLPARRDHLGAEVERRRAELSGTGGHARVPTMVADLLATLDLVLSFASGAGAVTTEEADVFRARGRMALLATAAAQAEYQRDSDPAARFVALLTSVLSSGRAQIADHNGRQPNDTTAAAAGWRKDGAEWRPQGRRIGWLDGDTLYLEPGSSLAEVVRLADEQGQPLLITERTLWKQLHEAGHLADTDRSGARLRYKIRITLEGVRREVIAVPTDRVCARASSGREEILS
jgi:hypothetical protein